MLDLELDAFKSQITEVVTPLFLAIDRSLVEWQQKIDSDFREAISEADHEGAESDARGEAAYRETTLGEQRQLMGAACLGFVANSIKESLDGMSRYFNTTHPVTRTYLGKSWLHKRQNEFRDRFGIDFASSPVPFNSIEEVILARNAGLHWDGAALEEYEEKVAKPRFIKDDLLEIGLVEFSETLIDVQGFMGWVHGELKKNRKAAPAQKQ